MAEPSIEEIMAWREQTAGRAGEIAAVFMQACVTQAMGTPLEGRFKAFPQLEDSEQRHLIAVFFDLISRGEID